MTHPLINLVTIALCGTIAGADDFVTMIAWARQHQDWLAQFLDLSHGIPSHDCLNMLFRRLKPEEFERCLLSWLAALHDTCGGTLVAIDGKTLRRSFDTATARSALHLVSAWAVSQKLSLGQRRRRGQEQRDHRHPRVAQADRADRGDRHDRCDGLPEGDRQGDRRGGGDYILAVKGNQPTCTKGSSSTSWSTWTTTSPGSG